MKKLGPIFCGFCLAFAFPAIVRAQSITNQPQSITVNNASTATFTVGTSNALTYQWLFNGTNLTDGGNIAGSTNSALTLEDVNTNQAGTYTVVINTNVVTSSNAVLTIVPGTIVTFTLSGFLGGRTSNVTVQLFNHDKPVTVQNFLHYITSGAYTNMFFDQCEPNYMLQGGGYGASNQTATTSPITGWNINQQYTLNSNIEPPFPPVITNEFNVGPLIHNRFGTIAMVLQAGNSNSANSAFFLNLTDNSALLDSTNSGEGPFVVFGRILDGTNNGTNVLQYFNALTAANGMVTATNFMNRGSANTNLPVNYIGTNAPANSNLVFCAFQITSPAAATNLPSVFITSPTANVLLNDTSPLIVNGAAVDNNNIGLASVRCDLIPLAAADGTLPNGGVTLTKSVIGTASWTVNFGVVPPGMYKLGAQVQDEAANLSQEVYVQPVIVTAIAPNGTGTITFTNGAFNNLNAVGYPFQNGSNYNVLARPGNNQLFVSWTGGGQTNASPGISFTMSNGLLLTPTFIANSEPQSITVNNASTAAFSVAITNALSYQWQFNGSNIAGATSSALTLEDVNTNQAGSYTVVIDNLVTSSNAMLTIVPGTIVTFTLSGFLDGSTSNVTVQLFNHDKPVTVQNFLHYITSGAYTNMFFDRCATNFVLQGGDYGASNQTATTSPITGWNINQQYTLNSNIEPPFPSGIINEFNVGPLIHNRFGTIAMAKQAGQPNSASSAFFFSLADNSSNLDNQNGGFTVFGQILDATNVLQYFNGLTNGGGIVATALLNGNVPLSVVPVNYIGTNAPANSNLVFCDFQITSPAAATNLPSVFITSPTANVLLNAASLTVQGTAVDNNNIGLASVRCDLIPLAAPDGVLPNGGVTLTKSVVGAANWTVNFGAVPPGMYELGAQAQDEAGNLSAEVFIQPLTITAIITNGIGTVTLTNGAFTNLNAVGYPFQFGSNYNILATPGTNLVFAGWTGGGLDNISPAIPFTMSNGLLLTATFISNSQPQSITINNGSTAAFNIGVNNALSYQWQLNGSNIAGATSSVLTLEDVNTNQAGTYTVVIDNLLTSSNAVLTILPGTIIRFILSGFADGSTSNVDVQLFDHDKPATVQNFLHYITSGAYTNMFFDRCSNNFVLQGGDDGTSNRTAASPPLTGWNIFNQFTTASNQPNPPFPYQVDSEYNVGPLINNRFGTLAMAKLSNRPDSASSAFFFNLFDNTSILGAQNDGGFTVFGRILNGTNVLQYFNTLSNGNGIVSSGLLNGLVPISTLPVDYTGTNPPANSNLFYCDFTNVTPLVLDTNPPTVSITSPAAPAVVTNLQGTASDDVGLAVVICVLTPHPAADGTYPYPSTNGAAITNYASGTTNWSLNLSPGSYDVSVQAQDGAGNLSPAVVQPVIVTAIITNGNGTVTFTNGAFTNLNAVGYPFQNGSHYNAFATAGPNAVFVDWTAGNQVVADQVVPFNMSAGFILTANFISNGIPNGLAFTYPTSNAVISTNAFNITGTISNVPSPPSTVICQVYSTTSFAAVGPPLTNSGVTANWSVPVSNLPIGSYSVEATAMDSAGNETVIFENFSVAASTLLQVNIVGPGTNSGATNGESIPIGSTFQVTAIPNPLQLFYSWSDNVSGRPSLNPTPTYTMSPGLTLTATFITNNIANFVAFTYPPANGIVAPNSLPISGTISNAHSTPVFVTCQIFSATNLLAVSQQLPTSGTNTWATTLTGLGVGSYILVAIADDAAGDSTLIGENFSVAYAGPLQLIIVGNGTVSPVANGEMLPLGSNFQATAIPGPGQAFYTWFDGTQFSSNATQTFEMAEGLALTATFIPNNTTKGISFTYPPRNALLATNSFPLKGRIASSINPARITCRIFQTNGLTIGQPLTTTATTTWSVDVTNLPGGVYTVEATATNASGMGAVISEPFVVLSCAAATGTYSGLFICTNAAVAPTNSGFMTFTVQPTGIFSGKLVLPAYAPIPIYPTFFENVGFTTGFFQFRIPNFHGSPLSGVIYLDLNIGTDFAEGTIYSDNWSSQLICYRGVKSLSAETTPATGKYIFSLQPGNQTNVPNTNGYASLAIAKNGLMALSGALPDNTTFSESPKVSKDGVWPLFAVPAGDRNSGMLLGWETNQALGNCLGQLYWYKAPHVGAYFTNGVGVISNMLLNSTGTNFSRPAPGNHYSIIFTGGTIAPPLTNTLTASAAGQFVVTGGSDDKLKISLSVNGVLTGHFVNPGNNKTLQIKGAFFGEAQGGSGFIPETGGQTGCFLLEPL